MTTRGLVLALVTLALLVAACGGGSAATLVTYERDWPGGYHEELTVTDDGRVTMRHGTVLERLTLTSDQVGMLRDALAAGLPMGDHGDALVRTVVLANGTSHSPVRVVPGSSVEILEILMTTHSLGGIQAEGATPAPVPSHDMGAHATP
ncbi:MAG: hypothetical protein KF809_02200 [Chloroflexi bacterium]|nr:hypothetical protein [Chloroflexota bacterium]